MKVITDAGTIDLGTTEAAPTIGIVDFSRRVTDDFGVTTVVERGFARRMSVRLVLPSDQVDSVQQQLAEIRATPALWVADERFEWLSFEGFYREFELDLALPPVSYCTLTVEGLTVSEPVADPGGDPAPDGRPSTLQLLRPVALTSAMLLSSNVPENDHPEWSAAVTYGLGAKVIKAAAHRVYESVAGGNVGNDPEGGSGLWIDIGPTNRWAMFDEALGTATSRSGSVAVTLDAGAVGAVALLDVVGATVRVQAPGYDETVPVGPGAITFLDLPGVDDAVTITVAGSNVEIGTLLVGDVVPLGTTEANPSAGINDFSVKETDEFGDVTIVERAWSKRMRARAKIRTEAVDLVANRIAGVRAKPSLWIGNEGTDSLTIYGFFRDFSIEVGQTLSTLELSIEGLSKAPPPKPLAPINWTDIVDNDPVNRPRPDDGADVTGENTSRDTENVNGKPADQVISELDQLEIDSAAHTSGIAAAEAQIADLFETYGDTASAAASAAAALAHKNNAEVAANNAEQAEADAVAARNLAQAAVTAAEQAKADAESAEADAIAAAGAAAGSASTAAGHASTATTKANEAAGSASAAAGSATTATTKAGEASVSAGQAASSATTAEGHKNAAASSATVAANARDAAQGHASAASSSAATAGTHASDAASSASAANTAKTQAETARGQAQTFASNASNAATDAAGSASSASSSAGVAASAGTASRLALAAQFPEAIDAAFVTNSSGTSGPSSSLAPISETHPAWVVDGGAAILPSQGNSSIAHIGLLALAQGEVFEFSGVAEAVEGDSSTVIYFRMFDAALAYLGDTYLASNRVDMLEGQTGHTKTLVALNTPAGGRLNISYAAQLIYLRPLLLINRTYGTTGTNPSLITKVRALTVKNVTARESAKASATAASTSASSAAASESAAASRASAAQTAANTATTKAGEASTSASSAATSASDALGFRNTASTHANNAANSATNAGNSASAASGSASTASTKASEAGTSASAAQTSATAAQGSANNASSSAATATTRASEASSSAASAASSATLSAQYHRQMIVEGGNLDFAHGLEGWRFSYEPSAPPLPTTRWSTTVFASSHVMARLSGGSMQPFFSEKRFAVDPARKYRLSCKHAVWSSLGAAAGVSRTYIGFAAFDANGNVLSGNGGTHTYSLVQNQSYSSSASVRSHEATVTGEASSGTSRFPVGTRQIAFQGYLNYDGNPDLNNYIGSFQIEDITESDAAASSASVASSQASIATAQAAAAQQSATLAANIAAAGVLKNGVFAEYPSTPGPPSNWTERNTPSAIRVSPGQIGPYAMRLAGPAGANGGSVSQDYGTSTYRGAQNGQWWVVEATIRQVDGTLSGAGLRLQGITSGGSQSGMINIPFSTEPDSSGTVNGIGAVGRTFHYAKLVQLQQSDVFYLRLYAEAHNSSLGSITGQNAIDFHRIALRPATPQEIRDQTVLGPLEATVSTQGSVLATLNSQYASLNSTVSTQGVTITNHTSALSTQAGNISTLFGRAGVKVDVNGRVTGWETNNNGQTGDFKIHADHFSVEKPGGGDGLTWTTDSSGRGTLRVKSGVVNVIEIGWAP